MAKRAFKTTNIGTLNDGMHADPATKGLYLKVRGDSRIWMFRYSKNLKAKSIGLGSLRTVGLAEARAKVVQLRAALARGIDPAISPDLVTPLPPSTFRDDALACFEHARREWDSMHATLWLQSLERHVFPLIGDRDTATLTVKDIVAVLTPLWHCRHETAVRIHGRIRAIIDHAADNSDDADRFNGNPADRALRRLPRGVAPAVVPRAALPWSEAPHLYARLKGMPDTGAIALRFLLLCCTPRAAEVIGARWGEVECEQWSDHELVFGNVWHVPGCRMKSGRARDIPLSHAATDLLLSIRPADAQPTDYIFRANRKGKTVNGEYIAFAGHLHDDAMQALIRDVLKLSASVHGMRSTFRTWVSAHAETVRDHDAAEIALDHTIGTKVARAYDRADMLMERGALGERWATFLMAG